MLNVGQRERGINEHLVEIKLWHIQKHHCLPYNKIFPVNQKPNLSGIGKSSKLKEMKTEI